MSAHAAKTLAEFAHIPSRPQLQLTVSSYEHAIVYCLGHQLQRSRFSGVHEKSAQAQ